MSNENCGCNSSSSSTSKEHLLVAATASEASTCSPKTGGTSEEACPKQEPTFDSFQSGFVIPTHGNNISVPVCNSSVYSAGQWIQTLSPVVTMQVSAINGKNIVLVNGCPNGAEIEDNPDAGLAIQEGTRFSVVSEPPCETSEEQAEFLNNALAEAEEICTPNLTEAGENAIVQVVGRIESDPDDTSFKKCIRRIANFLMKGGTPSFGAMTEKTIAENLTHKKVVRHPTSGDLHTIPNYSEDSRLLTGKQYALHVSKTKETPVGPVYFPNLFFKNLLQVPATPNGNPISGWPLLDASGEFNQSFNLGIFSEVSSLLKEQDHYYAMCRISIALNYGGGHNFLTSYLNDVIVNNVTSYNDSSTTVIQFNTTSVPIKVLVSDNNINLKLKASIAAASRYYCRLDIDGIYL